MCGRFPKPGVFWSHYIFALLIIPFFSWLITSLFSGNFDTNHGACWIGWFVSQLMNYRRRYVNTMVAIELREMRRKLEGVVKDGEELLEKVKGES